MQNVFSVNASNKIKRFQSDDLAGLFLSKPFNIHRMFCVLVPMTWSIGTRSWLKIHIMTERSTLFMAAMFNDSTLHKKKKNYAIIHTKYYTIMTGIIMNVISYKFTSVSDNLQLCDQT